MAQGSGRPPAATLKDIALKLGVSTSTVSRSFSRPGLVKEHTRSQVLAEAEQLGYYPNLNARGLRLSRTGLVCVVVPSLSPFFLEIFRGAEQAAREEGYVVLMGHTDRDPARERDFLEQVASRRADGIILVSSAARADLITRARHLPPIVIALESLAGLDLPTVQVDHVAGARTATQHLVHLGHRRIAHIAGPGGSAMAQHRREGFVQTLDKAGIAVDPALCIEGSFDPASGEIAMLQLMTIQPPPTAVFAGNDEMAIGAIRAARSLGLRVPEDVSIIGFDDQRLAGLYDPAVTTIQIPAAQIGFLAMVQLRRLLNGEAAAPSIILPTRLIERATTARLTG